MAINFGNLPDIDDAEFQSYIKRPLSASNDLKLEALQHGDKEIDDALPKSAVRRQHSTYASFGDNGTTATVNGYGTIMRVSKYLGGESNPSKMFGLEFSGGVHPYYVAWRAENFQDELSSPDEGFGLHIMDIVIQPGAPKLEFLNNQWPQVTYSVKGFNVRIRLFCRNGTVIQQFTVTSTLASAQDLQLVLAVDFLIQDLNYMDWSDYVKEYEHGPHGHSVIVTGKSTGKETEDGNSEELGVLVGLTRNGESQKLCLSDVPYPSRSNRKAVKMKYPLQESETLEFTAAFKLQYLKRSSVWKDFILPISDVDLSEIIREPAIILDRWPLLRDDDEVLSWHFRRNLEHILSVCSIPLHRDISERHQVGDNTECNAPVEQGEDKLATPTVLTPGDLDVHPVGSISLDDEKNCCVTPIALTCGDFGDHRVSVSGSYFAFQYLLSMHEQLGNRPVGDRAAQSIRSRIYDTCKGHLQWVSELNHDEAFASNFWVDGKVIIEQDLGTDIPPDSPANMPTHILKVTEFLKVFKEQKELIYVSEWLPSFVKSWVQTLIKTKNHIATTWRHLSDSQNIATYRLSDHVWIWKALQSIEDLITKVEEDDPSPHSSLQKILELRTSLPDGKKRGDGNELKLEFTAGELRKQILRRFTIENDISKKRMLGITRSARETRYLFHSRDTVLYYGIKWDFFRDDVQSVSELWDLLVKSQPLHDEGNDELRWDNPLRYALAVLMGMEGHQLDKNYIASDMTSHAKRVLLNSSSENGLFPGQIDETTKEPALFDRELFRDFYFHAGLEIPYILLLVALKGGYRDGEQGQLDVEGGINAFEHGKEVKGSETTFGPSTSPSQDRQLKHQPIRRSSTAQLSPIITMVDRIQSRFESSENRDSAATNEGVRNIQSDSVAIHIPVVRSLKRNIPYGKFVDLSNIVEMPEEWLYDYPRFLDFDPPKNDDAASILKQAEGSTIQKVTRELSSEDKRKFSMGDLFGDALRVPVALAIIDVPKGKKQRKRDLSEPYPENFRHSTYEVLWSRLQTRRTAKAAKKRLIYLGPGDCRVAALCYLTSPEMDREHVSQFFDRHATSRDFIVDDTTIASNVWETELHFSFYQLVDGGSTNRKFSPVRDERFRKCSSLKKDSSIAEAAIGFLIVGDFFDRYWTCHMIENFSDCEEDFTNCEIFRQEHWQQRKVLELILFERLLSKVSQSAENIICAIENGPVKNSATKKSAAGEDNIFGNLRFEDRSIENLQEILQILVVLKNNFASILEIIDLWEGRESTHGQERPRWTRNDEQKYRRSIKKHSARQEKHIRDLRNQQARIEFLITLVTSAQEAIRSARSLHEAENVRLFTYLTAFFLPVGLSSSLFGMGQIPDRNVVVTMVITAVIALSVTAVVLYCTLSYKFAANLRWLWEHLKVGDDKRERSESMLSSVRPKMKALRQHLKSSKKIVEKGAVGADLETGRKGSGVILDQEQPEGPAED